MRVTLALYEEEVDLVVVGARFASLMCFLQHLLEFLCLFDQVLPLPIRHCVQWIVSRIMHLLLQSDKVLSLGVKIGHIQLIREDLCSEEEGRAECHVRLLLFYFAFHI